MIVSEIGPVLAAHTGPGLLGVGGLPAALPRAERRPHRPARIAARDRGVRLRAIVRIVLIVVCVVLALYLIYLLRKPIGVGPASRPSSRSRCRRRCNCLNRHMRRGFAIAIVYLGCSRSRSCSAR